MDYYNPINYEYSHKIKMKPDPYSIKQTETHKIVSKEFFNKILTKLVEPTIGLLKQLFPDVAFPLRVQYYDKAETCYLNDGNTQCPGSTYEMLAIIPILRDFDDEWQERQSYRNATNTSCLNFSAEITLRDYDSQKRNYNYVAFYAFPFQTRDDIKQNFRITYTNHGGLTLEKEHLLRTYNLIKQIIDDKSSNEKIENALSKMQLKDRISTC